MASIRLDVISIGTLSRNRLWNESQGTRTPHATTTLIRAGKRHILVDPGLPPAALGARLYERTGLKPEAIDTIFLTNFRPAHRAGLNAFPKAKILIHESERERVLVELAMRMDEADDDAERELIQNEARAVGTL